MAGSLDASATTTAIISILQAGLAAKFDAIDALYDDDLDLEDIGEYRRAPVMRHEAFPAIVIKCTNSPKQDNARPYGIWVHRFHLQCILIGNAETGATGNPANLMPTEALTIRATRTMKGIVEVLEANDTLQVSGSDNADQIWIDEITYRDIFDPNDEDLCREDGHLDFRAMVSV